MQSVDWRVVFFARMLCWHAVGFLGCLTLSSAGLAQARPLNDSGPITCYNATASTGTPEERGRVYVHPVKTSYAAQERPTSVLDNEGGGSGDEFGRAQWQCSSDRPPEGRVGAGGGRSHPECGARRCVPAGKAVWGWV